MGRQKMEEMDLQAARSELRTVDHNAAEFCAPNADVRAEAWRDLRERCPVGRSENYGGYWLLSDYASVAEALRNADVFSHRHDPEAEDGINYIGVNGLPRMDWPELAIGEAYGEHHAYLRHVLNPFFSPRVVRRFEPVMQQVAGWLLDQHVESGSIDLMNDYITPVTSISTLLFLGFSPDLWQDTADMFHSIFGLAPDSPEYAHTINVAVPRLMEALTSATKAARENPTGDLLSAIALLEFEGQLLDDQHLWSLVSNIVGGGVDTTNNVTARGLHRLSVDQSLRARVIADPSLIDASCEEALRLYPSGQAGAATVVEDISIGGEQLRRGDHIVITISGANRDPKMFPNPDTFDLDRTSNRHLAFGLGVHRCLGAHVARQVYRVMVAEILNRIPDYVVDEAGIVEYGGNPYLMGLWTMPATFTPVPKLDIARPW
jgi:cytochrome P450